MCSELDDAYMEQLWNNTEEFDDIDVRDENMSRPIHSLLKKSKKRRYFFAVGAGHVVGNRKHLIVRLKKYGYRITRICTYEKVILKKFGCTKKKMVEGCIKKKLAPKGKKMFT
ncbi:unnamed protein product [Rotaria socialis]|uniref:Uncharacterized protein n=1 Tax=Rotaria socialis TaxID=392032 RepID=A0A821B2A0_9BILA|nr:unnamed protein product [Rotaria socialis]